jgi:hypothetical protein
MKQCFQTSLEKFLQVFTFKYNNMIKQVILVTALLAMIVMNLTAQNQWPILLGKDDHKTTYQQNGKNLSRNELAVTLKSNKESLQEYRKSAAREVSAGFFIIPGLIAGGGGLVFSGLAVGALFDNNHDREREYGLATGLSLFSCIGLLTIGGKIAGSGEKHLVRSINNYNNSLNTGRTGNVTICFGFTREGVGIRLRF